MVQPLGGTASTIMKFRVILSIPFYPRCDGVLGSRSVVQCVVGQATVVTAVAKKEKVLSVPDKATIIGVIANRCKKKDAVTSYFVSYFLVIAHKSPCSHYCYRAFMCFSALSPH